jgi:hypothetical protein
MKTELIIITDRSGSMFSIREDAQGGVNAIIREQVEGDGQCNVTLIEFDDAYDVVFEGRDAREAPEYKLHPRGGTALLDAIGRTLVEQGLRLSMAKADLVIVAIFTDGYENASREYSKDKVTQLVKRSEQTGWKFLWQCANLDAVAVARDLGSASVFTNVVGANAMGMKDATAYASTATRSLRAGMNMDEAALAATAASAIYKQA